jgi:dihydroxy-acid dehydratase
MDARTNLENRLPSRHVTEGPARAPRHSSGAPAPNEFRDQFCTAAGEQILELIRAQPSSAHDRDAQGAGERGRGGSSVRGSTNAALHLPAIAHECGIAFDLLDVAEVFKRTPYIADLKPAGRFVAKDLFEAGGVPLLMKTLLDNGFMHGDCMTVTGCSMAENLKRVAWNRDQDVVRPADGEEACFEAVQSRHRCGSRQLGSASECG